MLFISLGYPIKICARAFNDKYHIVLVTDKQSTVRLLKSLFQSILTVAVINRTLRKAFIQE